MNRFNLTFSGEIQAGHDPARVKLCFGKMFAIDDPVRLDRFFCGQTIILRRNLERKAAAQYYHELHLLGVVAALVKVTASEATDPVDNVLPPSPKKLPDRVTAITQRASTKQLKPQDTPPTLDQTWAVRSSIASRSPPSGKVRSVAKAGLQKGPTTSRRDTTDLAAKIKARKELSLQLAAEQESQRKAALQEQQRRAAEDSARQEAEKKHQEEAEAARRQALAAEAKRQAAEVAARKEAERMEIKRREAEAAARKKAVKAEARHKAAAEAARQKALREQEKAERLRLKAEETARRKAELEAIKRREAEEAARLQAELEEMQRREAEEADRLQAELAEIKRQEAEEAARIKADAQRKEAEAQRKSAQRRRAAAEQLAAQRALRKEEKRIAAVHQSELLRQAALEQQEQAALSAALQEKAVPRGAIELARASAPKPPKTRVRTSLEVPQRRVPQTAEATVPTPRKRQAGEPNLYHLRPFRNTNDVRERTTQAYRRMRQGYTLGAIALAAVLIAGGSFLRHSSNSVIAGASAIAIDPQSAPLLLAGDSLLFHDRAGVSTKEVPLRALGLDSLTAPLTFDDSGALLALGRLSSASADPAGGEIPQLLRCELVSSKCVHFSPQLLDSTISAFVMHPLDGSLLVADSAAGELLKVNRAGQIVARATITIPEQPVLRLHGGLLLMNSADGPAISVLRYEDNAFGQQLDEILLLPPSAQQAAQSRVGDFLWSSGTWWASLYNPASGSVGLYRFDKEWNYLDEVELPDATGPLQLVSWGEKTLVNDPRRVAAQRFNAQGAVEAPFKSTQLADLVTGAQRRANLATTAWRLGLLLCALAAAVGCGFGYLQSLRGLVYKPRRERGAEPVDDYVDTLHWIDPVPDRRALLYRRSLSYGLLVLGMLLLAIALSVTVWQLAALLLALCGPVIALLLLSRNPVGHIGVMPDRLLLVDHRGMYHLAGGSDVQYHGPFLMIDDVVVFSGSRLLPAFSSLQLQQLVRPLALGGVKVDRNTVVVKLLQAQHPFAQGACAIFAAVTAATMLLCLHGIF